MTIEGMSRILSLLLLSLAAWASPSWAGESFSSGTLVAQVDGSDCELCVRLARASLEKLPGVRRAMVDPARHQAAIELDGKTAVDSEALLLLLSRAGYAVRKLTLYPAAR